MVTLNKIDEGVFVAGQIRADDIAEFARQGVRTIVDNRPDGEEAGMPSSADLAALAAEHGLSFVYLPMRHGALPPELVDGFTKALAEEPRPMVAYCRTGNRSATLWSIASVLTGARTPDEALLAAMKAGYDQTNLRPLLVNLAQGGGS